MFYVYNILNKLAGMSRTSKFPFKKRDRLKLKSIMQSLKVKVNTSLVALEALAHRLQRRTACKIQNGRQGAPKWPTGSGKGSNSRLLAISSNFRLISFLIRALPL